MLACQAEMNEWVCDAVVAEAPAEQGEPAEHLQGPPAGGAGQVGCILQCFAGTGLASLIYCQPDR